MFLYLVYNENLTGKNIAHADGSTINGNDQTVNGGRGPAVSWQFETHEFNEIVHGRKGHTRLNIRYDITSAGLNYVNTVYVRYDGGEWVQAGVIRHDQPGITRVFPLQIQRCDRFQIRISGYGAFTVRSIERQFITGSRIDT